MRTLFFIISIFFVLSGTVWSKIYIDIKSPSAFKVGVGLRVSGYHADDIDDVIQKDLILYGIFRIYPLKNLAVDFEDLRLIGVDIFVNVKTYIESGKLKAHLIISDVATSEIILNKLYSSKPGIYDYVAHRISDQIYEVVSGEKGMFSRFAVAVRKIGNYYELCLLDIGKRSYKRVLVTKNPVQSPAFSPDRRSIVFSMMKGTDFDIYKLDLETGNVRRLVGTPGPDTAPVWSPDGKELAFSGYMKNNADIILFDMKTLSKKIIGSSVAIETSPSFSPDGKSIVFVSTRSGRPNIYIYRFGTNKVIRVSRGSYDVSPEWSPDGDKIAFSSVQNGQSLIKILYIDGMTEETVGLGEDPTWSINGKYLLYKKSDGLYLRSIYAKDETKIFSGRWENPYWR